jgi:hypothetical protein
MPLVEADRINQSKSIQDLKDLIDRRLNANNFPAERLGIKTRL